MYGSPVELNGSVPFEEQIREERLAESFPCLEVNLLEFVPGQVDPSNTSGHGGETATDISQSEKTNNDKTIKTLFENFLKSSTPLSSLKTYRMSLISAGSMSLDSTFNGGLPTLLYR